MFFKILSFSEMNKKNNMQIALRAAGSSDDIPSYTAPSFMVELVSLSINEHLITRASERRWMTGMVPGALH